IADPCAPSADRDARYHQRRGTVSDAVRQFLRGGPRRLRAPAADTRAQDRPGTPGRRRPPQRRTATATRVPGNAGRRRDRRTALLEAHQARKTDTVGTDTDEKYGDDGGVRRGRPRKSRERAEKEKKQPAR